MDEVFGADNFSGNIIIQKGGGLGSSGLKRTTDYILWYAKNLESLKYRQLFFPKVLGEGEVNREKGVLRAGMSAIGAMARTGSLTPVPGVISKSETTFHWEFPADISLLIGSDRDADQVAEPFHIAHLNHPLSCSFGRDMPGTSSASMASGVSLLTLRWTGVRISEVLARTRREQMTPTGSPKVVELPRQYRVVVSP